MNYINTNINNNSTATTMENDMQKLNSTPTVPTQGLYFHRTTNRYGKPIGSVSHNFRYLLVNRDISSGKFTRKGVK
tara:strand:- start:1712 stop:1939 length:228 start_codon:yes stop_codon:yes gene_type:complete